MFNIDASFYDADYFENGRKTGKSWYEDYHWMPIRSFKEALAIVDYLDLDENSFVLDFGCSKGFLVKALRALEIKAEGCDISEYALSFSPKNCWNCSIDTLWDIHSGKYTHIIIKDVLEHLTEEQLFSTLTRLKTLSTRLMCVVPIGDSGVYRIPEYHMDKSHLIAENEYWWKDIFRLTGWMVIKDTNHIQGMKDNWMHAPFGNHVYYLEYGG